MFSRITVSSVRRAAAIAGRAAFLAPLTRTVPTSGLPPRTTSLSIDKGPGPFYESRTMTRQDFSPPRHGGHGEDEKQLTPCSPCLCGEFVASEGELESY